MLENDVNNIIAQLDNQMPVIEHPMIAKRYQEGIDFFKTYGVAGTLYPKDTYRTKKISLDSELEIHNYTGKCPTLTYEISPVKGCHIGCLYCLVTDGKHLEPLVLYDNYPELVKGFLEKHQEEQHYYYFSAKTEAFSHTTLVSGVAHAIIKAFISHYDKYPDSKARLFIASKAGIETLSYKYQGSSLIDLFKELKGKMQFNTSISMMPENVRQILEPNAESIDSRLKAVNHLGELGIMANSALVQPILPYMVTRKYLYAYYTRLNSVGIINHKPEFLTACIENIAMIGRIVGYYDRGNEKALYEAYFTEENLKHVKQRSRMASRKELSKELLAQIIDVAKAHDVATSICYWVRQSLDISETEIPLINEKGFQCLGYQSQLF